MKIMVFDSISATLFFCIDSPGVVVYCSEDNYFWCGLASVHSSSGNSYVEFKSQQCHSDLGSDDFYLEAQSIQFHLTEVNSDA